MTDQLEGEAVMNTWISPDGKWKVEYAAPTWNLYRFMRHYEKGWMLVKRYSSRDLAIKHVIDNPWTVTL